MVTLSLTRSRIAAVLNDAASLLEAEGWDPVRNSVVHAIDEVAGFVPGAGSPDVEEVTLQAFDALSTYLRCPAETWERIPRTTQADVVDALREAATAVTS